MAKKKMETQVKKVGVPLKWYIPDDIITRFASNVVVQTLENEFKISFFEAKPEINVDPTVIPKEVKAECVASIIITDKMLPKLIDVLQIQLNLYNSRKKLDK